LRLIDRNAAMFPEEFIKRLKNQKYIDAEELVKALEQPSPVSIRINKSKWSKKPLNAEPFPWCRNGYYLANRPSYTMDPLFHSGCYYPQEASGMFLEQAISQTSTLQGNFRVLDLCAAPGGKSTHLSDIIGPDNLLVANEPIRSRSKVLAETITKWGLGNTLVTQNDPADFGRLQGLFDIVVVDAPCSGEGMFRGDIAVREWNIGNTVHCSERQKRILMDIWPALKENGLLVYSTCTFNPGENEENIKWFIGKNEAECVGLDISGFKGITEIDFEGIFGYGFYPNKVKGEGFFISVIRKTGRNEQARIKSQRKTENRPDKNDLKVVSQWTNISNERIFKRGDEVFALPCSGEEFLHIYSNLKIIKVGTKVFTAKNKDYLASHELALSLTLKTGSFPAYEVSLSDALAFMRRDNFKLNDASRGWSILTYKGVNLGFVNNLGTRVNNYFPVEWRIRMNLPEPGNENIITWEH
jgi:16S rRNA C967 or C1407 C5-methylase (RsmB/RsmF family)/NOL1/NOP2/fmu family ribosome biogenesis protein